jgi:hypothetical protein
MPSEALIKMTERGEELRCLWQDGKLSDEEYQELSRQVKEEYLENCPAKLSQSVER